MSATSYAYTLKRPMVQAFQYTDSNSVDAMMDLWGTKGFLNSPDGLYYTTYNNRDGISGQLVLQKGDWLVRIPHETCFNGFRFFTDAEFNSYFEKCK